MPYRLKLESLDDDPEERDFETVPEAIAYAEDWFLKGYANDTISESAREDARAHIPTLRAALLACHEFRCSMFYERISFVPHHASAGQAVQEP